MTANLAPFVGLEGQALHPAWQASGLPGNRSKPRTHFSPAMLDSERVLKVSAERSYGVLTHPWQGTAGTYLEWRWRVDQLPEHADIATRAGDDSALKVCVMFDQPLTDIAWAQRASLALARAAARQDLPSATVCYVWDNRYPALTTGSNAYTARMRYIVLDGPDSKLGTWYTHRRNIAQDFEQLFGQESSQMPPVIAVAIAADTDNTQDRSLAYVSQLRWLP